MANYKLKCGRLAAIVAGCVLAAWSMPAIGQEESSMLVDEPATVMPMPADDAPLAEPMPADRGAVQLVTPRIVYRTHLGVRRMMRCNAPVNLTVLAEHPDPCVNCAAEVPLCIPCCCTGEPRVTSYCGLLGRGVVEYCWSCGFTAKIVFRARGDMVVHYRR